MGLTPGALGCRQVTLGARHVAGAASERTLVVTSVGWDHHLTPPPSRAHGE
ncbi:MAG: hypothetical protein ACYDAQ_15415 [Mycobacteriales bacterium]